MKLTFFDMAAFNIKAASIIMHKLKEFRQSVIANRLMSVSGKYCLIAVLITDELIITIENSEIIIHLNELFIPF